MARKKRRKPKAARNRTIARKRAKQTSTGAQTTDAFCSPASTDFSRQTAEKSSQVLSFPQTDGYEGMSSGTASG